MDEALDLSLEDLNYSEENGWGNYVLGMAKTIADHGYTISGMDIVLYGNIPSGAGLSSSASIELLVGEMFNQIYNDGNIPMPEFVRFGQLMENEFIGVRSGIMDQFAIGMGKKDHAIHLNTDTLAYRYVPAVLTDHLFVIMNTGKRRQLKHSRYNERREECERALALLQKEFPIRTLAEITPGQLEEALAVLEDPVLKRRVRHVVTENARVEQMMEAMSAGDAGRIFPSSLRLPGAGTKIIRKDMCKQAFSLKPPPAGRMYPAGLRRFFISKDFRAEKRGFNCQIIAGML